MAYFFANFGLDTIDMREYHRPLQELFRFRRDANGSDLLPVGEGYFDGESGGLWLARTSVGGATDLRWPNTQIM